jgi:hypothetical protein
MWKKTAEHTKQKDTHNAQSSEPNSGAETKLQKKSAQKFASTINEIQMGLKN